MPRENGQSNHPRMTNRTGAGMSSEKSESNLAAQVPHSAMEQMRRPSLSVQDSVTQNPEPRTKEERDGIENEVTDNGKDTRSSLKPSLSPEIEQPIDPAGSGKGSALGNLPKRRVLLLALPLILCLLLLLGLISGIASCVGLISGTNEKTVETDKKDVPNVAVQDPCLGYGSSNNGPNATGTGSFKTSTGPLSEEQITSLCYLATTEQGSSLSGGAAEISLLMNHYDMKKNPSYAPDDIVELAFSQWFGNGSSATTSTNYNRMSEKQKQACRQMVKTIVEEGKRTLPGYINEHQTFGSEWGSINTGDVDNREDYIPHKTYINANGGSRGSWGGGSYWFYCFPSKTSDPFGYSESMKKLREKIGDDCYSIDDESEDGTSEPTSTAIAKGGNPCTGATDYSNTAGANAGQADESVPGDRIAALASALAGGTGDYKTSDSMKKPEKDQGGGSFTNLIKTRKAMDDFKNSAWANSSSFVALVARASGYDSSFPINSTKEQGKYLKSSDKWTMVGNYKPSGKKNETTEGKALQPGDIVIKKKCVEDGKNGHIGIFVGTEFASKNKNGKGASFADAHQGKKDNATGKRSGTYPHLTSDGMDVGGDYVVFRPTSKGAVKSSNDDVEKIVQQFM